MQGPIGIVGAGAMGSGIAQVAAQAGIAVRLFDVRAGAARAARDALACKSWIGAYAVALIAPVEDAAALAGCTLVIEAITEALDAKRDLFARLDAVVSDDCILATNTSSLSVTEIAAGCRRPERVAGFHFFNPVPRMRVVEVIAGARTAPAVIDSLRALAARIGHRAIVAADTPGFIVNHAGRAFGTEALRIAEEGVADFAAIDRILRDGAGFRMGPFELLDLTGLDISHRVTEAIHERFYGEPRYRPSYVAQRRLSAGRLGRKSGGGFHDYPREDHATSVAGAIPCPPVWIAPSEGIDTGPLRTLLATLGATVESGDGPSRDAIVVLTPIGEDATAAAIRHGQDAGRSIAIDPITPPDRHRTLMVTPATDPRMAEALCALLWRDGAGATIIRDSLGFVAQRTLAMVVNLACDIAQQRIATPADIDDAVRLGLGYPHGPLSWGDRLGPVRILRILETMGRLSGDPRYRPSGWLRRRAQLGLSLLHRD
jgi:3-hydroxybutyryl-CoA dehydrogenase